MSVYAFGVLSAKPLLALVGAILLAVVGALFGSAWVTGIGGVVALSLVALHPAVASPGVPRSTRLLLRGGLLFLTLTGIVELWGWVALPFGGTPPNASELIALGSDPVWQWEQFLRQLAIASFLILSSLCFGVTIARLPRKQLRRFGSATPTVGPATLITLALVAFLLLGLTGSLTEVAVVALLVLGGYAWVMRFAVRRYGTAASIAVVGATVLGAAAWLAVDEAWPSLPRPRDNNALIYGADAVAVGPHPALFQSSSFSVAVDTGLEVETALVVAALLLGSALTVLACARLSVANGEAA